MSSVKVSIIVPIYNVEKYLHQCLESIVNQTLKDIEIICVNDGSTDASLDIINEFVNKDNRVRVINKTNTGYGNTMNIGFDNAKGEYLGIVESDDYADPCMFEVLYKNAKKYDADVVKSGYYLYFSSPKEKNIKVEIASSIMCNKTICPTEDFKSKQEQVEFFNIKPTIWSSIYKTDFIRSNNIRFNETPGASYQDASFNFKVWASATKVRLLSDAFLHYRQDNENSSVNSKGKVFCVCDEYDEMQSFLNANPLLRGKLECLKNRLKYDSYMWNYERLGAKFKYVFIERASAEFKDDMQNGTLEKEYFEWYKWKDLLNLIDDPINYHTSKMLKGSASVKELAKIQNSKSYKIGRFITFLPRKFYGGIKCIQDHGLFYTFVHFIKKIKRV
ncbi:hypothetical protein CE91St54_09610 [Hungatella hathewayi]|uniref:Glycosyltransferase 2-like domain-containing protein n=1 Tax=Hungatella hathewayi TaxID=154046 RepID=A0AA37JCA6_9FIRM|nr:glycosyltransferase family 2 protein [Hungatella hathewayi]GKG99029.1 hypothetical protein CE91St55_10110 [Hungatella hathewayi]GKH05853.1 hypothetical protein CE91St54_09610 [Hungatella hathewayi]